MKLSSLSPEQRRGKLATAAGWKRWQEEFGPGYFWTPPGQHDVHYGVSELPEYDVDLNACHHAEVNLTNEEHEQFCMWLEHLAPTDRIVSAPASLRVSALLLTLVEGMEP